MRSSDVRGWGGAVIMALVAVACEGETVTPEDEDPGVGGSGGGAGVAPCADDDAFRGADGTCRRSGIPPGTCPAGFAPVEGGCEAELPDAACANGQMALPGESCTPVGDCGTGTWGNIPVDGQTVYVDAGADPMVADGTAEHPFPTIMEAVFSAPDGGLVAVGAGTYDELVTHVVPGLTLWGRCAAMVRVTGDGFPGGAAIEVLEADGGTLRGVTASTASFGLGISDVTDFLIDEVVVENTSLSGMSIIQALGPVSDVVVRRSLIDRASEVGISVAGASVSLEEVEVRDMQPGPTGLGVGVSVRDEAGVPGGAVLRDVYVHGAQGLGVALQGGTYDVERLTVRDVVSHPETQNDGSCLVLLPRPSSSTLTARFLDLARCQDSGMTVSGTAATLSDVTVRDVEPESLDGKLGTGISLQGTAGLRPRITLDRASIIGATTAGVLAVDVDVRLADVWVQQTRARPPMDLLGDGITVLSVFEPTVAEVTGCRSEDNARAGLTNFSAGVTLRDNAFFCNAFDLDGEPTDFGPFDFEDGGGNVCGCDGLSPCQATTANLAPPQKL